MGKFDAQNQMPARKRIKINNLISNIQELAKGYCSSVFSTTISNMKLVELKQSINELKSIVDELEVLEDN